MSRSTYFDKEAQDSLIKGLNLVADAVESTLGPAGMTVVIQKEDKNPVITKDGVSVAKEISPKDEKVKLGADLAISIAKKQLNNVGDGTSTATVLGREIVKNGMAQINLMDRAINRTSLRKGIDKAKDSVIDALNEYSKKIETDEQLVNIATISANNDEKLGKVVADAYKKVGKDGVVLVEETKERDIALEFKEGMTFDRGWISQYFVNNQESQTVEYEKPAIILSNGKISNFNTLVPMMQSVSQQGRPIVIIAEGFDSSVIQGIAMNIIRSGGALKIACVEAPGYGDNRLETLRDIAAYTGAKVGDDPMGMKFDTMTSADFGSCEKIIIKKDETIINGATGEPSVLEARINSLKGIIAQYENNPNNYEKELYIKRLARLTTGIAVIKVGGSSEEEIKELRDRLDDACAAVKAALEEGYLPGAGNTLLYLSEKANMPIYDNEDEKLGGEIFFKSIRAPFKAIINNAGMSPDNIMKEVLAKDDITYGFNSKTLQFGNLVDMGVIDPTKAVKGSVYAAASIAGTILTSRVIITEDPKEENGITLNATPMPY